MEASATAFETLLTSVTSFVTGAISWMRSFVWVITDRPLLLAFTIVSFVGLGVGLIKRIIRM